MYGKKISSILLIALLVALVGTCGFFVYKQNDGITHNVNKMIDNAITLRQAGETDSALYQLQLYCSERPNNSDGYMLLGDWSMEDSNTDKAFEYYKTASQNMECEKNQVSENVKIRKLDEQFKNLEIKIYPNAKYTKNMKLYISGQNLTPEETFEGKVNGNSPNLAADPDFSTTDWFDVDNKQKHVVLSGNINCAIWQFMDNNGHIESIDDNGEYKMSTNVRFANKTYSSIELPDDCVKARVTYYDKGKENTFPSKDGILITYGSTITGYSNQKTQVYDIPDLKEGQYVIYSDKKWQFFNGESFSDLDWEAPVLSKGLFYSTNGDLCGVVEVNTDAYEGKKGDKKKQYGLRYANTTGIATGIRLGHAKGMDFDYTIGNEWANNGSNDFDSAYPWCEMKLCNVKVNEDGSKTVTYEGDKKFRTDGSNGNVMVQIPKFYSKRVVTDRYEELWISGTQHKGYQLDPVFEGSYGAEYDYVYMSAYLGAEKDDKIVSVAKSYPTLMLPYGETLKKAENNGSGFSELNYLMVSALQRLFVIETGTIDSSSLFAGDTFMFYYYDTDSYEGSGFAAESAKKTNTITLYNNFGTEKITVGSSIAIFSGWDSYDNNKTAKREVTDIKVNDRTIEVTFDGKPVNITKHKTTISNIPQLTGKTGTIDYCTGTLEGEDGKVSFKYRNIENLYGSALIMLDDDAYALDGYFNYTDGSGTLHTVSDPIPHQATDLTNYADVNTLCCVKKMTYDSENPLVMMPSELGNGASVFNYYGDYWMYNNAQDGTKKYLLYGGADDNSRLAGIFHMRAAILSERFAYSFYSARIMCR